MCDIIRAVLRDLFSDLPPDKVHAYRVDANLMCPLCCAVNTLVFEERALVLDGDQPPIKGHCTACLNRMEWVFTYGDA